MSLFLDIGQGAGLAAAGGVRPYLPPLVAGAAASADAGIDFDGTSYAFLEEPPFLAAVLAVAVISYFLERRRAPGSERLMGRVLLALSVAVGALFFAGSLAAGEETSWWGLPAGAAVAVLAYIAVAGLFAGARRRLDASQADLLNLFADALAVVIAAAAVFLDPSGYAVVVALAFLALRARRRSGEKYAGLRILR